MFLQLSIEERDARAREYKKKLDKVPPRVDNKAPTLTPELYIKSKMLVRQSLAIQEEIQNNLALISKINTINRTIGRVNCWEYPKDPKTFSKLRRIRQIELAHLTKYNKNMYRLLTSAKTTIAPKLNVLPYKPLPLTRNVSSIENTRGSLDSTGMKNMSTLRRYWMEFETNGGVILGRITIELFERKCPITCQLFKKLIKGTPDSRAYAGTRVYMIVPEMFCALGDVVDNDGFGEFIQEEKLSLPENFLLNHYSRGVLSMHIQNGYVNGMFNITFRAMPLLDGKAVVFGRVVGGRNLLGIFSDMGTMSGLVMGKLVVNQCGWKNKHNKMFYGAINTTLAKQNEE